MPIQAAPVSQEIVQNLVEEKEIPYGYVLFYAGVRFGDVYTSPILTVHLYKTSAKQTKSPEEDRTNSSLVEQK
ncbi:unnamed protein product, partial [Rotaria sordida]